METAVLARLAIRDLIDAYWSAIDDGPHDTEFARRWFTTDIRLEFPPGTYTGIAGAGQWIAGTIGLWRKDIRRASNYIIELDVPCERAEVTATLTATHLLRDDDPGAPMTVIGHAHSTAVCIRNRRRLHRIQFAPIFEADMLIY